MKCPLEIYSNRVLLIESSQNRNYAVLFLVIGQSLKPSRYNYASIFILYKSQTAEERSIHSTKFQSILLLNWYLHRRCVFFGYIWWQETCKYNSNLKLMDVSDLTCEYKYYLVVNKGVHNEAYWNQPLSQKCKFIFQVFYKKKLRFN